jgi:uncharacterized protein YyaL (SSP411 family)
MRKYFNLLIIALIISSGCEAQDKTSSAQEVAQEVVKSSSQQSSDDKPDQGHAHQTAHKKYPANALAKETSPYLLMHAHNPVRWYAWNDETLAKAKSENKPIFLSIGYSSCHWCHVMERESFYDEEIANLLNDKFICIKVDREERPDVDEIYMEALMTYNRVSGSRRGGGWPLSMFMLPDGRPFFGGTYFPARTGDRGSSPGFLTIVTKIDEVLTTSRDRVEQDAELITKETRRSLAGQNMINTTKEIQASWMTAAQSSFLESFDPVYGGFRFSEQNPNIPKFPEPSNQMFLLDQIRSDPNNADAKRMFETNCQRMMMGGIYDHLGGGFHRYSVDRFWKIPHYEKMLYDNGQMASLYAEAFALTGQQEFKQVVDGILTFVDRELTAEQGGFYSSLDAESEGEEGKFYVWSLDEIKPALTDAEYTLFASIYGLNDPPNFEGKSYAPQLTKPMSDHAKRLGMTTEALESKLIPIRQKLFDVRSKRVRPLLDNKILTSWNGMMIRGYADAGRILKNERYVAAAAKAADFALQNLVADDGRLYRTHTNGESKLNAYVIDYACLVDGLLALHRANGDTKWLQEAEAIQKKQDELFWDEKTGGYFYTSKDHEVLLARSKKPVDGVIPAGNSIAAGNLLYLADQLKNEDYRERAKQAVLSAAPFLERQPIAAPRLSITAQKLKLNRKGN